MIFAMWWPKIIPCALLRVMSDSNGSVSRISKLAVTKTFMFKLFFSKQSSNWWKVNHYDSSLKLVTDQFLFCQSQMYYVQFEVTQKFSFRNGTWSFTRERVFLVVYLLIIFCNNICCKGTRILPMINVIALWSSYQFNKKTKKNAKMYTETQSTWSKI